MTNTTTESPRKRRIVAKIQKNPSNVVTGVLGLNACMPRVYSPPSLASMLFRLKSHLANLSEGLKLYPPAIVAAQHAASPAIASLWYDHFCVRDASGPRKG